MYKKQNLVLIPGFATNGTLLAGLVDYLSTFFNYYFIELPGFTHTEPPLTQKTLENYAKFTEKKISEIKIAKYILGGGSMGFGIINKMNIDQRCTAILALAPYINKNSINMRTTEKTICKVMLKILLATRLCKKLWHPKAYSLAFPGVASAFVKNILDETEQETFFELAYVILTQENNLSFHKLPHVLIVNPQDKFINYKYTLDMFEKYVPNLMTINTDTPHLPIEVTKDYFEKYLDEEDIRKALTWVNKQKDS